MNRKKTIVFMLTAVMLLSLAAPSFAAGSAETEGALNTDGSEQTETAEEITEEEADEEGEGPVQPDEEADPQDAETGAEDPEGTPGPKPKAEGIEVSYTAYWDNLTAVRTTIFSVNANGNTYTGTCARQGVAMNTSGTARITRISNSEKIAKVVYHYAIELGNENWWDSPANSDKVGKIIGLSSADSTRVTKRRMIECFCQIHNMGASEWYNVITDPKKGGWGTAESAGIRNYYNSIDTSGIRVPDSFEIWYADAGDDQPFIIWTDNPYGFVTMKKVSGNSSITG